MRFSDTSLTISVAKINFWSKIKKFLAICSDSLTYTVAYLFLSQLRAKKLDFHKSESKSNNFIKKKILIELIVTFYSTMSRIYVGAKFATKNFRTLQQCIVAFPFVKINCLYKVNNITQHFVVYEYHVCVG